MISRRAGYPGDMEAAARNRLIVAGVVLVVAAAIAAAAPGVIAAIAVVVAVIALLVALVILGAAMYRLVQEGAGKVPSDGDGS